MQGSAHTEQPMYNNFAAKYRTEVQQKTSLARSHDPESSIYRLRGFFTPENQVYLHSSSSESRVDVVFKVHE